MAIPIELILDEENICVLESSLHPCWSNISMSASVSTVTRFFWGEGEGAFRESKKKKKKNWQAEKSKNYL